MIADRLREIHALLKTSGEKQVTLIAVSKGQSAQSVREAIDSGQRVFGENRVQEAKAKFLPLRTHYNDIELHLIGPLQTNKVDDAVRLFDVIHTLDRPKLADALVAAVKKHGRSPRLYIEVNVGREPQKSGCLPEDLPGFLEYCREKCGLTVSGLMCIPPAGQDPRPYFMALHDMALQHKLPHLSMGMSADFREAVACGATEVRVGSAIFGERL